MAIEQAVRHGIRGQRGAALVGALAVIGILATIAMILMMSLTAHVNVSGHTTRTSQAADVSEAGVTEALSRIYQSHVPNNGNPRQVTQIFLTTNGSQPTLGADSTALVTGQPGGAWLPYSTAGRSPDVLTVTYKTNPARTQIYRYRTTASPRIQTASGFPIYVVTSTGRKGPNRTRIRAEVAQNISFDLKGALVADYEVKFNGNAFVCGYNHRLDTPASTGEDGRTGAGGCNEDPGIQHWELGTDNATGVWSSGDIQVNGAAADDGVPPEAANQAGFYAGPWDVVGLSQSRFFTWVGAPQSSVPGSLNGPIYLDNNSTIQDRSGSWHLHGNGSGILYIDGDADINAGFTYRGLIYVEGNLDLNGHASILGSLIVKGDTRIKITGAATVLYSRDAVAMAIASSQPTFHTITWREIPN